MNWLLTALIIFGVAVVTMITVACILDREPPPQPPQPPAEPPTLPQAGYFPDTGPLLLLGEKAAANAALEREIEAMCAAAERLNARWYRTLI